MNDKALIGKTALVTGSTSGIGLAIAKTLAGAGAQIAVHGLVDEQRQAIVLEEILAAGAPECRYFECDLRDVGAITTMMASINKWTHATDSTILDILVNNAGVQITTTLEEASAEIWDEIIAVNMSAAFHTMHHAMPPMAKQGYGRVVNIASVHGLVGSKNKAPYVASKFGLVGLSKVAALEYADCGSAGTGGVTVNTICPGWTETALIEPQIQQKAEQHGGDRQAGVKDLLSEKQPSQRISDGAEIGAMVLFLCAPIAHNITGTSIPIDGGWTAQ